MKTTMDEVKGKGELFVQYIGITIDYKLSGHTRLFIFFLLSFLLAGIGLATDVFAANGTCNTDPSSCIIQGLVGFWAFDEGNETTAYDSTENNNDGTLMNMDPATDWVAGKFSTALDFDGSNDYVDCGNMPKYSSFTIEAWVKSPKTQETYAGIVFAGDSDTAWGLAISSGSVFSRISNGTVRDNWYIETYNESNYPDGWHFIVITNDGTTRKYYRDGVYIDQRTNTLNNSGTDQLIIGRWGSCISSTCYFNGTIDEVRIYNRALSAVEVQYHYNGTILLPNNPPVLDPIGNKSIDENESLTFNVSATDLDENALTYSATDLPNGSTFSNQTFSWTPTYKQAGSYAITFNVSDGKGGADSEMITIDVNDVPATYYVSLSGNDSNDGTTQDTAWRTITYATAQAEAGDTVFIKAGDYGHEHVVVQNSGTAENPIVFEGYKNKQGDIPTPGPIDPHAVNEPPVIDATEMPLINGTDRSGSGILIDSKNHIEIKNIQVELYEYGVRIESSTYVTLDNIIATNLGVMGIYLVYSNYCNILNSIVTDAWADNIILSYSNFNLIENCASYGIETDNAVDYYLILACSHDNTIRNFLSENKHPKDPSHPGHGIGIKDWYSYPDEEYREPHSYNNKFVNCVSRGNANEPFYVAHGAHDNEFINCTAYSGGFGGDHAFRVRDGAHDNTFINCKAVETTYGIFFDDTGEGPNFVQSQNNNTFLNCVFENVKRQIYFGNTQNNMIKNCVFAGSGSSFLFAIEDNNSDNKIVNSIIINTPTYMEDWNSVNSVHDPDPTDDVDVTYSDFWNNEFATPSGAGNIGKDPLFADPENGDFHLKSQYGRLNGSAWVYDNVTSPCIDACDPVDNYSNEPEPNGNRINMGAYGNTSEASKGAELYLTFKNPTPSNNIHQSQNYTLINISITENASLDKFIFNWDGKNEDKSDQLSGTFPNYWFFTNRTGFTDGTYTYYGWANDSTGKESLTETRTITIDTTPPSITLNETASDEYKTVVNRTWIYYEAHSDSDENLAGCLLEWDENNETMTVTVDGMGCYINMSNKNIENHTAKIWANDSAGNWNSIPTNTKYWTYVMLPDLTLTAQDIGFFFSGPYSVTITATIRNIGNIIASLVNVGFFNDSDDYLIDNQTIGSIDANNTSSSANITWYNATVGIHDIIVKVDPNGVISEANESNNEARKTLIVWDVCDLNHNWIVANDSVDLMIAYKCFLGIGVNCNETTFQDWKSMKRENQCVTNVSLE